MKHIAVAALALGAFCAASPVMAGTNVGVSIGVNEPGVYGRINIGDVPPPVVVSQPVVIAPSPVAVYQRPIYLYVPAEQQHDWARYCGRYGACGQPVYFVQEKWAREHGHHGHEHEDNGRREHGRHGHGHGHDRDD